MPGFDEMFPPGPASIWGDKVLQLLTDIKADTKWIGEQMNKTNEYLGVIAKVMLEELELEKQHYKKPDGNFAKIEKKSKKEKI